MKEFKRDRKEYHAVGKCIPKKDSDQLLLGKPVFKIRILFLSNAFSLQILKP